VLHLGITSELHQVNLLIAGLQNALQTAITQHHRREMETAIHLARAQEHREPTTVDATQTNPDADADSDHPTEQEVDAPSSEMKGDSAQTTMAAAPTPMNTPTKALVPRVGYNTGAAAYVDNNPHQAILTQLHLATTDERKL
jgi:hypothetical protein